MQLRQLIRAFLFSTLISPAWAQNTAGGGGSSSSGNVVLTSPLPLPTISNGVDGGAVNRVISTDTAGRTVMGVASAAANGLSPNYTTPAGALQPWGVYPYWFNGATMDKQFYCNTTVANTVTAIGATQILPVVTGKSYYICAFRASTTPAVALQVTQGTGSNCATGSTGLSLALLGVTNVVFEPGATAAYRGITSNAVCITLGAAQTVNYDISYTVF
jgi:hypothetical protein